MPGMTTDTNQFVPGNTLVAFRCRACLGVFFSDRNEVCPCHGDNDHRTCEVMGRVVDARTYAKEVCACDARCTHASGPHCECHCGGVNHGTGRTVEKYMSLPAAERLSRTGQADWYHGVWPSVKARAAQVIRDFRPAFRATNSGGWMSNDAYADVMALQKLLRKAGEAKTVKGRWTTVNALIDTMAKCEARMEAWGYQGLTDSPDVPIVSAPKPIGAKWQDPTPKPLVKKEVPAVEADLTMFGDDDTVTLPAPAPVARPVTPAPVPAGWVAIVPKVAPLPAPTIPTPAPAPSLFEVLAANGITV